MMNHMQIMKMIKGGGNPQQMLMNMMKGHAGSNPVMNNALQMMEKGDNAGLEKLARNLCSEKGINADEAFNQIKGQFEMK